MPRILAVLDEFQVLFNEDDRLAQEAGRLLEDIARRGASFGVHLILSSQSPSGGPISGRRIYDQMALRIALRCRAQDASAILGEGNDAASRLERPGEAVYNEEMGQREKNVFIQVALLADGQRRAYLAWLRDRSTLNTGVTPTPPITFEARTPARIEKNTQFQALLDAPDWSSAEPSVKVWLGQPIEIKTATTALLERYVRSNVLIVGGDEAQANGLLVSTILSIVVQKSPHEAAFHVADFSRPGSQFYGLFSQLRDRLPHGLQVADPKDVGAILDRLLGISNARANGEQDMATSLYFVVSGLHRWRELRPPDPYGQTEAGKQLLRLAEEGPELGIHLVVWADDTTSLERVFKRAGLGAFDLKVVLRVAEADSNGLLGSPAAARLEDNRAFFRNQDWEMGRLEKFKPYAVPDARRLERLLERVSTKEA